MPPKKKADLRVKGVQVHRPFIYGSYAKPIDAATRDPSLNPDHTHRWTIYIRPVPPTAPTHPNLTHWLKKVQFKLHETYAQSTRTIEAPGPFEVTETGWGEFEVQMKLFFVPEANEKATTLWHALKLHPYGERAEEAREKREPVVSQCYEEVVFTEPVEAFFDILTSNGPLPGQRGGAGKGAKGGGSAGAAGAGAGSKQLSAGGGRQKGPAGAGAAAGGTAGAGRTAEIPEVSTSDNAFSRTEEEREIARLREAMRKVEGLVKEERKKLEDREKMMASLKKEGNGTPAAIVAGNGNK